LYLKLKQKDMKAINDNRLIGGVCTYLGKNKNIPTWLWRLFFIITPGSSILYLIIWFLID